MIQIVTTLRAQVEELATQLDRSKQETADLRNATDHAIAGLQAQCDAAKLAVKVDATEHDYMRLVNDKVNAPPIFDGNRKEVRGWSRSVKAYLDSKYPGFRKMLTIIERAQGPSNEIELSSSGWKWALPANKSLYNMLISYTKGEPQIMLENSDPEEGFECWRKLIQHYDPLGGDNELTTINTLLNVPRCKSMNNIIKTVEQWEREWAQYIDRTKESLPERWKVSLLLRMIPAENEREIRLRYVKSKDITYAELRENLFAWVQQNATGAVDMHISSAEEEERRAQAELARRNKYALLATQDGAEYGDDDEDDNATNFDEINLLKTKYEQDLAVLRAKGGKKGNGRQGAKTSTKATKKFDGDCSYCKKRGHKAKDCRKRIADAKKRDAGALGDEESEAGCGILENDDDNHLFGMCGSLDIDGDSDYDEDFDPELYCCDCSEDDEEADICVLEQTMERAEIADALLDKEMAAYIEQKEVEIDNRDAAVKVAGACTTPIHGTAQQQQQQQQQQQPASSAAQTPVAKSGFGSSPNLGTRGSPITGASGSSAQSTAERFKEQIDRLMESFSVVDAGSIPVPSSLRETGIPPGLEGGKPVSTEAAVQTDISVGPATWIVSLARTPAKVPSPSTSEQDVTKFDIGDASDGEDGVECVDCIECENTMEVFKDPSEYDWDVKKEVEFATYWDDMPDVSVPELPHDARHGRSARRAIAKKRRREAKRARELANSIAPPRPTMFFEAVDELAPIDSVLSVPSGGKSDWSKPAKSPSLCHVRTGLPQDVQSVAPEGSFPEDVRVLTFVMIHCIILAANTLANEVMDWDAGKPIEQPLLVAEAEKVKKSIGRRLQEKLASMIRIKRGFTIDSGAADHVIPLGWLAWIVVTASRGSLAGMNFISANGAKIPNKGEQRVRFMTSEGTWATWIFQVAGINKPLVSVSKLIADGWKVIFDEDGSYIIHKATGHTIDLRCERGIFTVDAFVEPSDKSGFHRQA